MGSGPLPSTCDPQYNLLVDGTRWVKDPAADGLRPDGFGGVNSVIRL
jgi:hypothetical protein